ATGTLPVSSQMRIARRTETASRHCRHRREKREVKAFIVRSSSQSLVWSTPRSPERDQCVERSGAASHHTAPHDQRQYDRREDHQHLEALVHLTDLLHLSLQHERRRAIEQNQLTVDVRQPGIAPHALLFFETQLIQRPANEEPDRPLLSTCCSTLSGIPR